MTPPIFIIARIIDVRGSSPRENGAYMLISPQGTLGSIGGGRLEHLAIETAHSLLNDGPFSGTHENEYTLGPELGQCCGGRIRISYQYCSDAKQWLHPEHHTAAAFQIVLFGAGHVGKALAAILATQHCQLHWIDNRQEQFPTSLPANTRRYTAERPTELVKKLPSDAYILVMTHDHALDMAICDAVLRRNQFRFLGLIGSQTKLAKFRKHLLDNGHSSARIDRITSPIGIPQIHSKQPERIALAVAAQLLALQEQESPHE